MARRRRAVPVDERTVDMSDEAVYCRRWGHSPTPVPPGAKRRAELEALGQYEERARCLVCGYTRGEIIDSETGDVVGRLTPKYPENYRAPRGSGRMLRAVARRAYAVRNGLV